MILNSNADVIKNEVNPCLAVHDIDLAASTLDKFISNAHKASKIKLPKENNIQNSSFKSANHAFETYSNLLKDKTVSSSVLSNALESYNQARKLLHYDIIHKEAKLWSNAIETNDSKKFWQKVDWKGNMSTTKPINHPTVDEFTFFFSDLYKCESPEDNYKISQLNTNLYIPVLDDPIDKNEVHDAIKDMKKGGFDYNLQIIHFLFAIFSPMLSLMLNIMFFYKYPAYLAKSILSVIPKKGNLLDPKNYRGIQMMRALGCLFDRIIFKRIYKWMNISSEQSAFQKGKSTLHQIFIIRILIALANHKNITLYIAFVDITKAFDKVSRYLMLKKLIKLGIGSCMLHALKQLYSYTSCTLSFYGQYSHPFKTTSGIRQGAASSVLLFILFMDDLFRYLHERCDLEPLIDDLHALIHADDTIIISTNRHQFINKCNHMTDFFTLNKLSLNLNKSSYMIINPGSSDFKTTLKLKNGFLPYKEKQVYLGAIISDKGDIRHDIRMYITDKKCNVTVKFANFIRKNINAPFMAKLKVLDMCCTSSLIYGCETWSDNVTVVEPIYRHGLKLILGVKDCTNNEIVYIESNRHPLACTIKKQQLKFWLHLKQTAASHPQSALAKLMTSAETINLSYIKYYHQLENKYASPSICFKSLQSELYSTWKNKIVQSYNLDNHGKLGTYLQVNPDLKSPIFQNILELERITLTRFRTGSHSLAIESGRYARPKIPRELRLCQCGEIQTVLHVLSTCPITKPVLSRTFLSLQEAFKYTNISNDLLQITNALRIST